MAPNANKRSGRRVSNGLVALSSAAVLTVYSAGYLRTRAAADKLEAAERSRVVIPAPPAEAAALPERSPEIAPPAAAAAVQPNPKPAPRAKTQDAVTHAAPTTEPLETPAVSAPATASAAVPAASITAPAPLPEPTPAPTPAATPQASQYKDGTYSGWGTSRHGDIEATVTIAGGRITSALITQCLTRYSCSWVSHLQGQVVTRQSAEVDYVSGATQSANAFYYAVVQALSKAR
jgi:uncharacterized protein with FMN-binding domain